MTIDDDGEATARRLAEVARVMATLPQNVALGFSLDALEPGRCVLRLAYRPVLAGNPVNGVLHGGVVTTLIDSACGIAIYARLPSEASLATLDMRIDYLRPAEPDRDLLAEAEVYRMTSSVAFARAHAYQGDPGNLVAHCAASFMVGSVGFTAA